MVCDVRGPFFALQLHAVYSSESRLPLGFLDRGSLCWFPFPSVPHSLVGAMYRRHAARAIMDPAWATDYCLYLAVFREKIVPWYYLSRVS